MGTKVLTELYADIKPIEEAIICSMLHDFTGEMWRSVPELQDLTEDDFAWERHRILWRVMDRCRDEYGRHSLLLVMYHLKREPLPEKERRLLGYLVEFYHVPNLARFEIWSPVHVRMWVKQLISTRATIREIEEGKKPKKAPLFRKGQGGVVV